jgi:hypothetical protein
MLEYSTSNSNESWNVPTNGDILNFDLCDLQK